MTLSVRQRRYAALGLLLAAFAIVWLAIIAPIAAGFTERAALRQELRERSARDAEATAGFAAARRASRALAADRQRWLGSDDIAALQQRFAAALAETGGEVRRIEDAGDAPAGSMRVRAEARLELAELVALLQRLGNDAPLLVIDRLEVAVPADEASGIATQLPPGSAGQLPPGSAGQLDIRIEALAASSAPR